MVSVRVSGDDRKRQIRLFNIQRLIMERVGFERRPNVSSHPPMSSELLRSTMERHRLNAAIDAHLPADYLSRRVITLLPACKRPSTYYITLSRG